MKEMDTVKLVAEKERYAQYGVHKGMYGWICYDKSIDGTWLVNFPQWGDHDDLGTIAVAEEDLLVVPILYATVTEAIHMNAQHPDHPLFELWKPRESISKTVLSSRLSDCTVDISSCCTIQDIHVALKHGFRLPDTYAATWDDLWKHLDGLLADNLSITITIRGSTAITEDLRLACCPLMGLMENLMFNYPNVTVCWDR